MRDRQHRFPGRKNALKVLYDDVEVTAVRSAAETAGLTPTGFVAAAGLTLAGASLPPASSLVLDTPKTAAGIRTVHIPPHLPEELREHLAAYPDPDPDRSLVFTNGEGRPLSRGGFRSSWVKARERVGLPTFRFHDLRHTGNTLAAATGASTKELMARMGHASMRAALIYQHASADRDAAIAAALSQLAAEEAVSEAAAHSRPPLRAERRARPRATGT